MKVLTAAKVSRMGRTARIWNYENDSVRLDTGNGKTLSLRFSLSSKGGGITEVRLAIGSEDFAAIASIMASADRVHATQVMAATLASELAKQCDYDKLTIRSARNSAVEAANQAYIEAPEGRDHAERLTLDMVKQLVTQLNSADSTEMEQAAKHV